MAEGAGTLVLESYEAAVARGATILGVVAGCGELTDSFHRTRSSPDGKPIIGCVHKALADAGMTPEQIDHINAHGTATPENDKMEYIGISAVFGERAKQIPVSSNKSMIGHTISAAGAVEAIILAADARASADSADHQLRYSGSGDSLRRGPQRRPRRARHRRDVEFVRVRRPECLADPDARTDLAAGQPLVPMSLSGPSHQSCASATPPRPLGDAAVGAVTIAMLRTTRFFDPAKTADRFGRISAIYRPAAARRPDRPRKSQGRLPRKIRRKRSRRSWPASGTISAASAPNSPISTTSGITTSIIPRRAASKFRSEPTNCLPSSRTTASRR